MHKIRTIFRQNVARLLKECCRNCKGYMKFGGRHIWMLPFFLELHETVSYFLNVTFGELMCLCVGGNPRKTALTHVSSNAMTSAAMESFLF